MFTNLPIITNDNWDVMVEKDFDVFIERFRQNVDSLSDIRKTTECVCHDITDSNPNLVDAVYTCSRAVAGILEKGGVDHSTALSAGMLCLSNILPVLRLIERSFEAQELEKHLFVERDGRDEDQD